MNDKDLEIADDWMRDHMPDPDELSFEDAQGEGNTEKYFFLRYRDSASVVYLVTVEKGQLIPVKKEVYYAEGSQEGPDEEEWIVKPKGEGRERQRR